MFFYLPLQKKPLQKPIIPFIKFLEMRLNQFLWAHSTVFATPSCGGMVLKTVWMMCYGRKAIFSTISSITLMKWILYSRVFSPIIPLKPFGTHSFLSSTGLVMNCFHPLTWKIKFRIWKIPRIGLKKIFPVSTQRAHGSMM